MKPEELAAQEAAHMEREGWYSHYVFPEDDHSRAVNCHTHGVRESFGHPDLQLVLPIAPEKASDLLRSFVLEVKKGRYFKDGQVVDDLLQDGFKVKFVKVDEGGREVLRVILPDPQGNVEKDAMDEAYAAQYQGCDA